MKIFLKLAISVLLLTAFEGCTKDPTFSGFEMTASAFVESLNTSLASDSIVLPAFEPDIDLKNEGGYDRIFRSSTNDITLYIYTRGGQDGIRIISNDLGLREFTKVSEAVIKTLEPSEASATEVRVRLYLGKAESSNYSYTSGTSIPEDENGISNFTQAKWVFNASPKQKEN